MNITPEEVLKIVRIGTAKSEQSSIGIIPEYPPINIECDKIPFNRMVIRGGMCHGFFRGWFFKPYKLIIEKGFKNIPKNKEQVFYFSHIEESTVVEEYENKEETPTQDVLDKWNQMITEYNTNSEVI